MDYISILLEIIKYTMPSLVCAVIVYVFLSKQSKSERMKMQFNLSKQSSKELMPIRLQAFERMTLFLERISPNQLIMRIREPEMDAADLHSALVFAIRQEYEHNISQQLYISESTWQMIVLTKDQLINDINSVYASVGNNSSGIEFSRAYLNFYVERNEPTPNHRCLNILKNEFNAIFS
mgnify:FL=1